MYNKQLLLTVMIESFLYSMQVDLLTQDSLMFELVTNSGEDLRP